MDYEEEDDVVTSPVVSFVLMTCSNNDISVCQPQSEMSPRDVAVSSPNVPPLKGRRRQEEAEPPAGAGLQ